MKRLYLLLILLNFACNQHDKKENVLKDAISLDNYSIQITFSSFFENGVYKKVVLDNSYQDNDGKFDTNTSYVINFKGGQADTVIYKLTKQQADSIFLLTKCIIDSSSFSYQKSRPGDKIPLIRDGGNVELEIRQGYIIKKMKYLGYSDTKDISPNLDILLDRLSNK